MLRRNVHWLFKWSLVQYTVISIVILHDPLLPLHTLYDSGISILTINSFNLIIISLDLTPITVSTSYPMKGHFVQTSHTAMDYSIQNPSSYLTQNSR